MNSRIIPVLRKEAREILRDPYTLGIALFLPLVMLFLFGYAMNMDVRNITTAVYDQDLSQESRDYVAAFVNSGYFKLVTYADSYHQVERLLDSDTVEVALVIPSGFSSDLTAGRQAQVQTLLDGSYPPGAKAAINYATAINEVYSGQVLSRYLTKMRGQPLDGVLAVELEPRVRYNPTLKSINYIVPGLFAVILMAFPPLLSALAVVREKESGSIQNIFVAPVKPYEFIAGKMIPYGVIAYIEMLMVLLVGAFWFRVPFKGSMPFLLLASLVYVFCTVGIGLLVSTVTRSQLAAMLLAIVLTMMPSFLFSGFIYPVSTLPYILQLYTYLFPARYFIEISRDILLKGQGLEYLWPNTLILFGYTFLIVVIASLRFRKKL
ncbi:MAG: ABC transporter permease [Anaerolineae bacterium]